MELASSSAGTGAGKTGAVVGFLAVLAVYKAAMIGFGSPLSWIAGYGIDVAVVGVLWIAAISLQRAAFPGARIASGVIFWPLLALWFAADFAYTYFFPSDADRHYSLLDVGPSEVRLFVSQLLPLTGWLVFGALVVVWGASAIWIARLLTVAPPRRTLGVVGLVSLLACTLAWRVPDVPNPAVDIARDIRGRMAEESVSLGTDVAPAGPITLFDRSATSPISSTSRFKHIVVIVMETMPIDTYRDEVAALPPDNFFRHLEEHGHSFTRYYTSNQDSRTAMLDMLSSRMVPFEAYDDAGVAVYQVLNQMSNLPAMLHAKGYETLYALAQQDSEMVVADLPWQRVMTLTQQRIDSLKPHALCFYPFEFENSCEDKVLLGDVVNFIAQHDRSFVYQEMMWGHDLEYNKASGKGNVEYVSEFADSLWRDLTQRGLADSTLLVLTGDHGEKADDREAVAINYQVPLIFYSPSYTPSVDDKMRSHLDFKDLLLRELDPSRAPVAPVPFVHVVGPTDTHLHAVIDSTGGFLAYKTRGERAYVTFASTPHSPNASAHVAMFEQYKRWFSSMVPKL